MSRAPTANARLFAPSGLTNGKNVWSLYHRYHIQEFLNQVVVGDALQLAGRGSWFVATDEEMADLQARDERDTRRTVAPLVPAEGAYILDTSDMTVDEAVEQVLHWNALL